MGKELINGERQGQAKARQVRQSAQGPQGSICSGKASSSCHDSAKATATQEGRMKLRHPLVLYLACCVLVIVLGRFGVSGLWSGLVSLFSKCQPGMEI